MRVALVDAVGAAIVRRRSGRGDGAAAFEEAGGWVGGWATGWTGGSIVGLKLSSKLSSTVGTCGRREEDTSWGGTTCPRGARQGAPNQPLNMVGKRAEGVAAAALAMVVVVAWAWNPRRRQAHTGPTVLSMLTSFCPRPTSCASAAFGQHGRVSDIRSEDTRGRRTGQEGTAACNSVRHAVQGWHQCAAPVRTSVPPSAPWRRPRPAAHSASPSPGRPAGTARTCHHTIGGMCHEHARWGC